MKFSNQARQELQEKQLCLGSSKSLKEATERALKNLNKGIFFEQEKVQGIISYQREFAAQIFQTAFFKSESESETKRLQELWNKMFPLETEQSSVIDLTTHILRKAA